MPGVGGLPVSTPPLILESWGSLALKAMQKEVGLWLRGPGGAHGARTQAGAFPEASPLCPFFCARDARGLGEEARTHPPPSLPRPASDLRVLGGVPALQISGSQPPVS